MRCPASHVAGASRPSGPVVRWTYVGVLLLVAVVILVDYRKATKNKEAGIGDDRGSVGFTWFRTLHRINIPPMMEFQVSGVRCSMWLPICVTFVTGVFAGFLGIGGGFLRMPALIYLVGCPTHIAVGTDLFEVMISGLYGTFTYGVKGRIEIYAVFVMLTGAGDWCTDRNRGYQVCQGIRYTSGLRTHRGGVHYLCHAEAILVYNAGNGGNSERCHRNVRVHLHRNGQGRCSGTQGKVTCGKSEGKEFRQYSDTAATIQLCEGIPVSGT